MEKDFGVKPKMFPKLTQIMDARKWNGDEEKLLANQNLFSKSETTS